MLNHLQLDNRAFLFLCLSLGFRLCRLSLNCLIHLGIQESSLGMCHLLLFLRQNITLHKDFSFWLFLIIAQIGDDMMNFVNWLALILRAANTLEHGLHRGLTREWRGLPGPIDGCYLILSPLRYFRVMV